jgi:hypothetical protein
MQSNLKLICPKHVSYNSCSSFCLQPKVYVDADPLQYTCNYLKKRIMYEVHNKKGKEKEMPIHFVIPESNTGCPRKNDT